MVKRIANLLFLNVCNYGAKEKGVMNEVKVCVRICDYVFYIRGLEQASFCKFILCIAFVRVIERCAD